MKDIKNAMQEYENMLLDSTKYTGNLEPEKKIFSASMLGDDILQNFYKFKYGGKNSIQFEANTFGSIYQLGVDSAVDRYSTKNNNSKYISALRLQFNLPDTEWIISGEMDQIDTENRVIFDNKVTTTTTISKIKSEGKNHQYALQMAVYKWLLYQHNKNHGIEAPQEYEAVLAVVDKKFSYFTTKKMNQLTFMRVNTYSIEETEQLLQERIKNLNEFIDLNQEPGQCQNLFWYQTKGQAKKPMRCIHYCDYATKCKYFNDEKHKLNMLLDL